MAGNNSDLGLDRSKREFLKAGGIATGALVFGFSIPSKAIGKVGEANFSANAYLSVNTDGSVVVMCSRAEMGQGVYTSLTALIADELDYDLEKIQIKFAPVAEVFTNDY